MASGEAGTSAHDYWDRVEEVFAAALAAEDSARTAVLDARCAARADLRAEVEALLAAHARAGEFITPHTLGGPLSQSVPRWGRRCRPERGFGAFRAARAHRTRRHGRRVPRRARRRRVHPASRDQADRRAAAWRRHGPALPGGAADSRVAAAPQHRHARGRRRDRRWPAVHRDGVHRRSAHHGVLPAAVTRRSRRVCGCSSSSAARWASRIAISSSIAI